MRIIPWIEKYRPKNINDLIINDDIKKKIKNIIKEKKMPNLIIAGTPGVGKTTTVQCIAKAIFGENYKDLIMEINASDDRGIKAQDHIIFFCKKKYDKNKNTHKIIILDEADNITPKAQCLISNLIEKYQDTTRFAFTCNSNNDIIDDIQSRCMTLYYSKLTNEQIVERLQIICKYEKIKYTDDILKEISFVSNGDLRTAINNLQLIYVTFGKLSLKNLYSICNKPPAIIFDYFFDQCKKKKLYTCINILMQLKKDGYLSIDIIVGMSLTLKLQNCKIEEDKKIKIYNIISNTFYNLNKGIDNELQLYSCVANIIDVI